VPQREGDRKTEMCGRSRFTASRTAAIAVRGRAAQRGFRSNPAEVRFSGATSWTYGEAVANTARHYAQALDLRLSYSDSVEPTPAGECQRNIEMIWSTGQPAPDFKTSA